MILTQPHDLHRICQVQILLLVSVLLIVSPGSGDAFALKSNYPFMQEASYVQRFSPDIEAPTAMPEAEQLAPSRLSRPKFRRGTYDSYRHFDPSRFEENSPEWQMAMLQYLLDMRSHGHNIKEIETNKDLPELHQQLKTEGMISEEEPADRGQPQELPFLPEEVMMTPSSIGTSAISTENQTFKTKSKSKMKSKSKVKSASTIKTMGDGTIVCKMEPWNICYLMDGDGQIRPLGNTRPVRLLRVY